MRYALPSRRILPAAVASMACLQILGRAAPQTEVANRSLRVTLAAPSGRLAVRDLRNGIVWQQYEPFQTARGRKWGRVDVAPVTPDSLVRITRARTEGRTIQAMARWRGLAFTVEIRLARDAAALTVTLDVPRRDAVLPWKPNWAGVMLMTYPYAFFNETAGPEAVVPIDEGVVYSTHDTDPLVDYRRWNRRWLHQRLSMPWWGVTDGERGVMTQIDTPYDCMFSVQWVKTPRGDRTLPQVTWTGAKRTFAYPRRVTFRFLAAGGYVAMAKAFRHAEQARGAFRSWADKLRVDPAAARLRGALDVWHQPALTARLIADLRRAGVRHALISKPRAGEAPALQGIDPGAVSAAVRAGYLIGGYHNYSWIQGRLIARKPRREQGGIMSENDTFEYKKTPWDPRGFLMRCPVTLADALRPVGQAAVAAGLNYFFLDTTTTGGSILECYHPKHPLVRRDGAAYLRRALEELCDRGLVVGSERGKWWAASAVHVFEGIETLSEYGGAYYGKGGAGHWVGPYLENKPGFRERCLGYDFNPARRLPLFQLVYHDSVYCTRRWNQDPGRDPSLWDRHDLMNILYGTAPLVFMHPKAGNVIGGAGWEKVKERYLRTYRTVCGWHEKIGFDEMVDHRFLSKDRLIQETRFASGWTVVVDFSDRAWRDPRGFTVPRHGYRTFKN
ncbi:MAG: hypothetical protein GXP31_18305 [Kiritimatiellaeota bacterium]|nr:hypothetical protein [Kiritimatiellota bacterium]